MDQNKNPLVIVAAHFFSRFRYLLVEARTEESRQSDNKAGGTDGSVRHGSLWIERNEFKGGWGWRKVISFASAKNKSKILLQCLCLLSNNLFFKRWSIIQLTFGEKY